MNNATSSLLAALGIGLHAGSSHGQFYADRSAEAFAAGRWGEGQKTVNGMVVHIADYESPDCPEGWDTVWGYLARTMPDVLGLMDQFPDSADSDERQLDALCRRHGTKPRVVSAGSWLARNGVFTSRAYPLPVLRAHLVAL